MPLRDDLLEPIEGENPSGPSLQYDKVFDQIKEARTEDDDSVPSGDWGRTAKKADRVLVIKLAGETLAKRTKDLRLASWYVESLLRKEGFATLVPGLELLLKLQETFWDTIHPEPDPDDKSMDLRIGALEGAANLFSASLRLIPLTKGGIDFRGYQDARVLGTEADATTSEKRTARAEAIERGKPTGEDLQKGVDATPKAFYAETEGILMRGLEIVEELDRFHEEKYGDDYPSLTRLKSTLEDVKKVVSSVLNEKRKTDPDPVVVAAPDPNLSEGEDVDPFAEPSASAAASGVGVVSSSRGPAAPRRPLAEGGPVDALSAFDLVAASADFLRSQNTASCVPYLLGTALRFGETRSADLSDYNFAVAPPTEIRQTMRRLATNSQWDELMTLCIRTLPEPCGRVWLDLQRYIYRAAEGLGHGNLAATVASTVRSLLTDLPAVRTVTLDDDTSAANAETQQWIDAEVLQQ